VCWMPPTRRMLLAPRNQATTIGRAFVQQCRDPGGGSERQSFRSGPIERESPGRCWRNESALDRARQWNNVGQRGTQPGATPQGQQIIFTCEFVTAAH
jgi:hypothetical protein